MKALTLLAAVSLAACSGPAPDTSSGGNMTSAGAVERKAVAPKPKPAPKYVGRWIGVEGMVLDVAPTATPGHYALTMQWDLDNKGKFDGIVTGDTISFDRGGIRETLRPTNGDATGLKYLSGKTDCLTVKPGEGYCRERLSR
ncbi:MAG: hypothetical protein DI640_01715 [Sphingomonas taxi]|uniref:Lipoprotein n=1 Tax=Sphingomonas taxi TaxID=1549858 RepID=A0A2W4Z3Q8_9SPHN|nr:MAG: hypothetical protein DI640_01715 [Sphingomonas taxi]